MFLELIIIKPNLSKVWELEGSKHLLANLAWPAVLLLKDLHQIEDLRMLWIEEKVLAWLGVHQGMEESGKAEDQLMLYASWYIHPKVPNWVSNNLKWICRMLCHYRNGHQHPNLRLFIETWLFPHQTNKPLSTENLWILLSNFLNYFPDKKKYVCRSEEWNIVSTLEIGISWAECLTSLCFTSSKKTVYC